MDLAKQYQSRIIKVADSEELAKQSLKHFIDAAQKTIQEKGLFYVAISGGNTPARLYELLSDESAFAQVDWEKVHLFWVDERCVPPSAEASNFRLAAHTFLLDIPIPGENIHRMTGEYEDYQKAAKEYERRILNVFGLSQHQIPQFDLIILGMGSDGHIGSLLPNTYALFDTEHLVCEVYRMDHHFSRLTLTVPVLKEAKNIMILISGAAKAEIVKEVFESEPDPVRYPVHALWPVLDKITWIIDKNAGASLG